MLTKFGLRYLLVTVLVVSGVLISACSSATTLETPQGLLKVEELSYQFKTGTINANDPHRLVLTLTRADNKLFSVDDLNYIVQSGAYLTDSLGEQYDIPANVRDSKILNSQTDKFRLEFRGKPGVNRNFTLFWPDNNPLEIKREKNVMIDG
jgi:hypothetical protein